MKVTQYHILNGDALKENFPNELGGELIVLRECMVEGNIRGKSPIEIFDCRKIFFEEAYKIPSEEYLKTSQGEIEKILNIPKQSEITLWFEDDLFCQTNLWFSSYLLKLNNRSYQVFLVRPNTSLSKGFGALDQKGLIERFNNRIALNPDDLNMFHNLWIMHQNKQIDKLKKTAQENAKKFSFLIPAIEALARIHPKDGLGEPHKIIQELILKYGHSDFAKIFRGFIKLAPIYGYGDMQVKRIFDELKNQDK